MRVTVWKNEKESNERAIARFNKKVQASRKLVKVRSERYHSKDVRKAKQRQAAVMREVYRAAKEKNKFY
ncbi:30S ribosomal protein S21 [Candidatus Peregrinibacteria bacterium]|nr:30S ribosomal protein S21 [Candidatus Peregrinibacteria bacterium]